MVRSTAHRHVAGRWGWFLAALAGSVLLGFLIGLMVPRPLSAAEAAPTERDEA